MRKLFLSAAAVFVFSGSPTQLMIAQFVACFAFGLVALVRPYADGSDNWVACYAHAEIVLILNMGQARSLDFGLPPPHSLGITFFFFCAALAVRIFFEHG